MILIPDDTWVGSPGTTPCQPLVKDIHSLLWGPFCFVWAHYIAQAGPEHPILSQPPECYDYRSASPRLALFSSWTLAF